MTNYRDGTRSWFGRIIGAMALMTVLAACGGEGAAQPATPTVERGPTAVPTKAPTWTPQPTITPILGGQGPYEEEPAMTIDPSATYLATLKTTKGDIVIQLLPDVAPRTVNSFVFLAGEGFYDDMRFHRVTALLIQTGDPTGTGAGDAGYAIPLEKSDVRHDPGAVGLAHPDGNPFGSSQFYIMKASSPGLDYQYTVFGQVVEGMDVVNAIERNDAIQTIEIEET